MPATDRLTALSTTTMSRTTSPKLSALFVLASFFLTAGTAQAIGISLSAIGGTALGGVGVVGDSLVVGIDLILEEGEYVTIVAPTLQWDQEGGNVLDVTAASESSILVNNFQLNPLAPDLWRVMSDPFDALNSITYTGTSPIPDNLSGPTTFYGFEQTSIVLNDQGIVQDILTNGIAGAGTHRIGSIEFLLSDIGTTEIGFFLDPTQTSGFRSLFTGSGAVLLPDNTVDLTPLDVSASGFASLQITVVPEPGTALLVGLGLAALATRRAEVHRP